MGMGQLDSTCRAPPRHYHQLQPHAQSSAGASAAAAASEVNRAAAGALLREGVAEVQAVDGLPVLHVELATHSLPGVTRLITLHGICWLSSIEPCFDNCKIT
jgi:hypothetical protein